MFVNLALRRKKQGNNPSYCVSCRLISPGWTYVKSLREGAAPAILLASVGESSLEHVAGEGCPLVPFFLLICQVHPKSRAVEPGTLGITPAPRTNLPQALK